MAKKPVTWKRALSLARKAGLLSSFPKGSGDFDDYDFDPDEEVDAESFFELLQTFYGQTELGQGTAFKDGYLNHDWRYGQETDDIISEFCLCAQRPAWFKLNKVGAGDMLFFEDESGTKHELCGTNLQDVADFFNAELRKTGSDRQFYEVETSGDFFAFICLSVEHYSSLAKAGIIPFVGTDWIVAAPKKEHTDAQSLEPLPSPGQFCDRARKFARDNKIDNALADYDSAIAMLKNMDLANDLSGRVMRVVAYSERGAIYFQRSQFTNALEDFFSAAQSATEPETRMMRGRVAYVMHGRAAMELGKFAEAMESFNKAIEINEYDPDAYHYRGVCRERMGKWLEAKVDKLRAHTLGFRY